MFGLGGSSDAAGFRYARSDTSRVGGKAASLGLPAGLFGHDMRWSREPSSGAGSSSSASSSAAAAAAQRSAGPPGLIRVLCSATMTSDPMRMAALGVGEVMVVPPPAYMQDGDSGAGLAAGTVTTLSRVPRRLREAVAVCKAAEKPLLLALELLRLWKLGKQALVFAGSVDGAHRLTRLL